MMAREGKIHPFRALLLDIANNVRLDEIRELKELSRLHITHERWNKIQEDDIHELLSALEDSGALEEGNFSFILTCLRRINRVDLALKVEKFMQAKQQSKLRVIYWCCAVFGPAVVLFLYFLLPKMYSPSWTSGQNNTQDEFLEKIRDQVNELKDKLSTSETLQYRGWSVWTISLLVILLNCLFTWLYQCYMPCSSYRMSKCRQGSIPGHVITFTFVTFDMQKPFVRGLEFEWDVLVKKLNLDFRPHPDPGVHYYLNYDRCGAGGVRHVASWLDSLPMIRGAEIFAVNEEATKVWYNLDDNWRQYVSAADIRCSHHGNLRHNDLKF